MMRMHDNENTVSLFCEECGAEFHVEHEMGLQYMPHYCPFCGEPIVDEDLEDVIEWEDDED